MTNRAIRASDQDREGVVSILRDAYTEGRLTLEEFDDRTSTAYTARTWGDLLDLTADLPVQPALSTTDPRLPPPARPAVAGAEATAPALSPRARRGPDSRLLPALFIWAVIAAAAGSPWIAGVLTVFFIGLLASRLSTRGGHGNTPSDN